MFAGHELKTPVTVMKASLDMLEREGVHSKYLDYAVEENEKMRKLVIELLDYSKMEYQEEKSLWESVDFSQCIEGISLEFEAMAFEKEVILATDIEQNLVIAGNKEMLKRMAETLLENAVRHTESGKEVKFVLKKDEKKVCFSVKNQGKTIPEEERRRIFEKFYHISSPEEEHYGLGLAIAQSMKRKQITAIITAMTIVLGITVCGSGNVSAEQENKEQTEIESTLNISNNDEITWSYDSQSDSWTMSVTCAVANPELPDYQGVSVNVPGAYVKGIDTDGDGTEDITGKTYSEEVKGQLMIDDSAQITNENGQTYTASTAPVIINTGAAGYSAQENQKASSSNATYGYINVACGNRGKQSTATDENGEEYYTGDAPLCLVDQKNAIRFVKYNIILGNLPGNTEYFVSTGGSGGGAHLSRMAINTEIIL